MKLYLEKKTYFVFLIATFFILGYATFLFYHDVFHDLNPANSGLALFYNLQTAQLYLPFTIVLFLVSSNTYGLSTIVDFKTKFFRFEMTRYKNYEVAIMHRLKNNFIISFLFAIFLRIVLLIYIHFFLNPISFNSTGMDYDTSLFPDPFINLILYILLSGIGFGLFCLFIQLIGHFLKNDYVFRGLGVIVGILLFILPAFLPMLGNVFLVVASFLYLPTLLSPGLEQLPQQVHIDNLYLTLGSFALYFCAASLLAYLFIKRIGKNGI
jgi:hypothetical protein